MTTKEQVVKAHLGTDFLYWQGIEVLSDFLALKLSSSGRNWEGLNDVERGVFLMN